MKLLSKKLLILIALLPAATLYCMETKFQELNSEITDAIINRDHETLEKTLRKISLSNTPIQTFTINIWIKNAYAAKMAQEEEDKYSCDSFKCKGVTIGLLAH